MGNVMHGYTNKQLIGSQNFFGFARGRVKRLLISNVSVGNIKLYRGKHVAPELRLCGHVLEQVVFHASPQNVISRY
jgi:hypothetical protein